MVTLAVILAVALAGSLVANILLWRLWRAASKAALSEARQAVLESVATLNEEVREKADAQARIDAADRGGAADVLERLRRPPA